MRTSGRLAVLLQSIVVSSLSGCGGTAEGGQPTAGGGGAARDSAGSDSGGAGSVGTGAGGSGGRVQTAGSGAGGTGAAAGAIQVGAAGVGGTGVGGTGVGGTGAGGQGAGGSYSRPSKPTCDDNGLVNFVDGLNLPTAVDFLGVYLNQSAGVTGTLYESNGTPCAGAADQAACKATLVSGAPLMGFTQYYLMNTTPRLGSYAYMYLAYTRGDSVGFVSDRAQLNTLLGPIDTANEAGVVFLSMGVAPECTAIAETDDAYYFAAHSLGAPCSIQPQGVQFSVTHAGAVSTVLVGTAMPCVGRRPDGLLEPRSRCANPLGDYYASVAHLEQAAVMAFAVIERELARFGAPQDLRDRASRAGADEIRHARRMAQLAQSLGAQVPTTHAAPSGERSLLAAALENAVEGCVREAWGALSAHYQSATARDPEAQRIWHEIAVDETEHAELSLALHEWYLRQLTSEERAEVAAALERARLQLRVELAVAVPPHAAVVYGAGVPDPICAVALFNELETQVLAA